MWASDIPRLAGVYAIWDSRSGSPVYVGETSGLFARMADLGRTPNHTFRRIVREKLSPKSNKEDALNAMLAERFEIAFVAVDFGRAELEEYLILRWRRTLYNKPAFRLTKSEQYQWLEEIG
jgi:hypothetical protein